jgi:predicted small metal-binding protein
MPVWLLASLVLGSVEVGRRLRKLIVFIAGIRLRDWNKKTQQWKAFAGAGRNGFPTKHCGNAVRKRLPEPGRRCTVSEFGFHPANCGQSRSSNSAKANQERFHPMAKSLSCKDVGVPCDFTARGETTEEVLQAAAQHAKEAHGFDTIPPELMSSVMAAVRDE